MLALYAINRVMEHSTYLHTFIHIVHLRDIQISSFTWTQNLRNKYSRNQSTVTFSISIGMF